MNNATAARAPLNLGGLAFVVLWSSGYIAAVAALQGAGPFTLAVLRFAGSAALIGLWLLLWRAPSVSAKSWGHALVAGALLQAGFFGFTYAALRWGVPAAVAGLITGLMPLTTTLGGAWLLGEPLRRHTLSGLVIGLIGVLLVIGPAVWVPQSWPGYGAMLAALLSLSGGTLYQKRHATQLDPRLALWVQVMVGLVLLLPLAWLLEGLELKPSVAFYAGVGWIVLINACAGLLLYLWLLRHGGAGQTASWFYLVPPVTALMAAVALDARFSWVAMLGFALAAAGVWLGQRS